MHSNVQWAAHLRVWEEWRVDLRDKAKLARLEGKHYKNFRVGAAALLYDPFANTYHVVTGSNYKTQKGTGGPRVCAEETALVLAIMHRCLVIGIVIVADYQPDDETGLPFKTLLPCVHCRSKFVIMLQDTDQIDTETQFESHRLGPDEEIIKTLPFTLESLLVMAPVTGDQIQAGRKIFRAK